MGSKMKVPVRHWYIQVYVDGEARMNHEAEGRDKTWETLENMRTLVLPGVEISKAGLRKLNEGKVPNLYKPSIVPLEVRFYEDPLFSFMVVEARVTKKRLTPKQAEQWVKEHVTTWTDPPNATPIANIAALTQVAKARPN